jgi:Ricin-type beta-trefoil lectin domain
VNQDGYSIGTIQPTFGSAMVPSHPVQAGSHLVVVGGSGLLLTHYWVSLPTGPESQPGNEVTLHPVINTSLCLTQTSQQAATASLILARCDDQGAQQFIGIQLSFTFGYFDAMIASHDARRCLRAVGTTPRHLTIAFGRCGEGHDSWYTDVSVLTDLSSQYADLYLGRQASPAWDAMSVPSDGQAGAKVVLARDPEPESGQQLWTDRPAGGTSSTSGGLSLRPLSDTSLCLTVPDANYSAGIQLQVQSCDGQADQVFVRTTSPIARNPGIDIEALSPQGAGSLCVGVAGSISKDKPVELRPCGAAANQAWSPYDGWIGWAN